jgi:UDP-N-acetylmuramoyl-tripeptide--D-alanyl-D-alanine ligase
MKTILINFYLNFLRVLAQLQLKKNNPLIVGITGSAGKSSCTKIVASVLEKKYKVKYTKKGNSETGIPFEILNIPVMNFSFGEWLMTVPAGIGTLVFDWRKYEVLVVEMGIDSDLDPKNMSTLLKIISPEIGVLLNANSVHLANFVGGETTQAIADEKAKLLFSLPKNGLAILNHDQKEFKDFDKKISSEIKTFSLNAGADINLTGHKTTLSGSTFKFNFKKKQFTINFENKLIFKEFFGSLATAILVGDFLGIEVNQIIKTLESRFEILPGRGKIFQGINDSTLIDSSYNSSLKPTGASLKMLKQVAGPKNRTVAILGDMRELGERAGDDHRGLEKIALKNADLIIGIGPLTKKYFKSKKILKFENAYQALEEIKEIIKANDLVLIKGSQNTILLEIIVEELLKNKSDVKNLCRRSQYWNEQRALIKDSTPIK